MTADAHALSERIAALKHDLGKYVAWTSVNLAEAVWTGPVGATLIAALQSDVLSTKKGPEGDRTAWEVWAHHTDALARPLDPPELQRVHDAVMVLHAAEPALRSGDPDAVALHRDDIRQAQQTIRTALATAHRTLVQRARDGGS